MNIVVNAVSPGIIDTDVMQFFQNSDTMLKLARQRTPAGRLVEPQDVANVVAFLCSSDAAMVRGQVVFIDGGWSIDVGRQWVE
jgi:enoyl-[acyl-carrier protein] reductase III